MRRLLGDDDLLAVQGGGDVVRANAVLQVSLLHCATSGLVIDRVAGVVTGREVRMTLHLRRMPSRRTIRYRWCQP